MVIFTSKFLIDVTEYFIYYDFYFFQNIDYVNYGQVVSYFLEFARLVKRTMVFALGRTQCSFWRDFGLIGKISVLPRRYWQVYSSDSGKIMNHTSMWSSFKIFYEVASMLCNCLRVRYSSFRIFTQTQTGTPQLHWCEWNLSLHVSIKVTGRGSGSPPSASHHVVTWLIFASVTLLFPTTSLIVRASQNHPLLMNFFEIVIIPFAARRERYSVGRLVSCRMRDHAT